MKENKPGYKHTPLGWIPGDWEIDSFQNSAEILVAKDLQEAKYSKSNDSEYKYPVYSNTVENNGLYGYYKAPEYREESCTIVGRGIGLGTAFYRDHSYGAIGRLLVLYPKYNLDAMYINYFVNGILKLFQESGGIPQLTGESLAKYKIIVPPLLEQKAIAKLLSTWDKAIEKTQELIKQKELRKKYLMQQLLTGKKRLKGFSGEWKRHSYEELLKVVKRPVEWNDDELYQLISVRRRSGGIFKRESLYGKQILVKDLRTAVEGDFLFSKMQIVHGASALVTKEFTGAKVSGSYIAVVSKNPELLNIEFLNWYSKMPYFYHQTYISSYGVHIEKMTFDFDNFVMLQIRIPGIVEQKAITNILYKADTELELLNRHLEVMQLQKKGLIQVLLSGKKRLKI